MHCDETKLVELTGADINALCRLVRAAPLDDVPVHEIWVRRIGDSHVIGELLKNAERERQYKSDLPRVIRGILEFCRCNPQDRGMNRFFKKISKRDNKLSEDAWFFGSAPHSQLRVVGVDWSEYPERLVLASFDLKKTKAGQKPFWKSLDSGILAIRLAN